MLFTTAFVALAAPFLVSAAPVRRAASANDILVLQFADVLEQLESGFYQQALGKFQESDFLDAGFVSSQLPVEQFTAIQSDEKTHDTALQAAITSFGQSAITNCQFNFDSVLTDVSTMAATARTLEYAGVSAYLGGATLIDDPVILDAAASILTVEARHQTVLNILSGGSAIPSAFDIPFTPSEVLAIASEFLSGCDLGIPAATSLSITNTGKVEPGTQLGFQATSINGTVSEDQLFCQMMLGGAAASIPLPFQNCVVPSSINGPVAIWITSDGQPLINNVRDRATSQQVAGPVIIFVDSVTEELSEACVSEDSSSGSHKGNKGSDDSDDSSSYDGSSPDSYGSSSDSYNSSSSDSYGSSSDSYGSSSDSYGSSSDPYGSSSDSYGSSSDSYGSSSDSYGSSSDSYGSSDPSQTQNSTSTTTVISLDQASAIVSDASATTPAVTTPTVAAAAAVSPLAQSNIASTPGGPNLQGGKSADGSITVIGWSNLPSAIPAPAAASAAPASAAPASGGYSGY